MQSQKAARRSASRLFGGAMNGGLRSTRAVFIEYARWAQSREDEGGLWRHGSHPTVPGYLRGREKGMPAGRPHLKASTAEGWREKAA
jgi:hypothetical protein